MAEVKIEESWKQVLSAEFNKPYFEALVLFLKQEKAKQKIIYPKGSEIFNAYAYTPYPKVKVVILGQDPYHGEGQAHGLAFSVNDGVPLPPSLKNIYKELQDDLGIIPPKSGNLTRWAVQGVFLLNTCLTVEKDKPFSHKDKGWEEFTDATIKALNERKEPIVFLLWGKPAQSKEKLITNPHHLVLKAAHPSPYSADKGFFGCRHFSKTNAFLQANGLEPIQW
ncbi:MAG: uracil-DNA glycosylase [Bacteroidia bacterium]|nr:uracil-DNA glycosylase [Bacteroidia bacterium]MDW8301888.1 uracil-DNA glycosylase [Bacteroidia bacterium]